MTELADGQMPTHAQHPIMAHATLCGTFIGADSNVTETDAGRVTCTGCHRVIAEVGRMTRPRTDKELLED